jgi:translation initiation factor IF-3
VTVQFRGREVSHAYIGRDLLLRFADLIKDHGAVDRQPILEGKSMSMTLASSHKPKVAAPAATPAPGPLPDGAAQLEAAAPPPPGG